MTIPIGDIGMRTMMVLKAYNEHLDMARCEPLNDLSNLKRI